MADHTHKITAEDHSVGSIMIASLFVLFGLTFIFILGIF
jgi:hypothetical protein